MGPDGRRCVTPTSVRVPGWARAAPSVATEPYLAAYLGGLAPCPVPTPTGSVSSPAAALAERFFQEVALPVPAPRIAPGRAITGLAAYLETRGATGHSFTRTTPFGPMTIVATGTYGVDWGDGTLTGPHLVEGRAWPHGEITHRYRDVGNYDVVVTEAWTATWRVGDQSGTLEGLRTTARIDAFPVGEIQAVVVNGP